MSFVNRVLLCVVLTALVFQTPAFAETLQLFVDPFQNLVFRWDGKKILRTQGPQDSISISDSEIETSAPPLAWAENEILFATQSGEILKFNTATHLLSTLYSSKYRCQASLNYSGCIYSIILAGVKKAYFTEHTRENSDTLMELTSEGARPLISQIPGPSGPIWLRPDGSLGALPSGHGILSIPIPSELKGLPELSYSTLPYEGMAAIAMEGQTSQKENRLGIFDFTSIVLRSGDIPKKLAEAKAAAFDPCSGWIWYIDSQGSVRSYVSGRNPYVNDFPVNVHQCPVITSWNLVERQGSTLNADRWDVLQGFPSGSPRVPSNLVVSLGNQGTMILESDRVITASGHTDLRVFENVMLHPGGLFVEPALIEIWDGAKWVSTGCDCKNPVPEVCAGMQVTQSSPGNGVLPWSEQAGGYPINLSQLGIQTTQKIRLTDCGNGSLGSNSGAFAGFDLNAVIVSPESLGPKPTN